MSITISQPLDYGTRQPIPDLMEVRFHWHTRHGFCIDCGLPAAYFSARYGDTRPDGNPEGKLCCVCAANDAAEGMVIRRIEELS